MKRIILCILIMAILFTGCSVCELLPPPEKGTSEKGTPGEGTPEPSPQPTPASSSPYLVFKPNGGVGGCTLYLKENQQNAYKFPKDIVYREGYKLKCWNTKPDGTGDTITSLSDAGSSTLYAIWEKDTQTNDNVQRLAYASNFLGKGGCMQYFSKQEQFPYTILEPMVLSDKYPFLYWNTHKDGSGKTFYPGDVIHSLEEINPNGSNFILYAIWDDPEDTINRLKWDLWLEYLDSRDDSYYGKVHLAGGGFGYYTIKEAPEGKENFLCWNTKPDGSGIVFYPGDIIFSPGEIGATELYAIWEEVGGENLPIQAKNLMESVEPQKVAPPPLTGFFKESTADFSIRLLQQIYVNEKNTLVSPLSVLTALAMTANGAAGETLVQMEQVLGGGISIEELNQYLNAFLNGQKNTDKTKMTIANSVWFREDASLTVRQDFLQKSADYYDAAAYKAPFDASTLKDINQWVKENTDGMIENALDKISPDAMLFLINTLVFDGQWQTVYALNNVRDGIFTNINGEEQSVTMMHSTESKYLDDGIATGFVKNYVGGQYSFVALLPNEGVSLSSYVENLTGASFRNTFLQAKSAGVYATIPKFSYDCDLTLNDGLRAMGMKNAFDFNLADFTKMGQSSEGNLYIGRVIHKTFISVDELGTKAGAVTIVEMDTESSAPMETYTVHLDRPFVYAIVDNATGIPVFMGTVVDLG